MEPWAELREAKIWYRTDGAGEPVLLLHGGLADSREFAGNLGRGAARELRLVRRAHPRPRRHQLGTWHRDVLALWVRLWGALGTGHFNIAVLQAPAASSS
jgi:hypothetical protein